MISVVVPVYNTGKYLKKCIESILAQTVKNIELILVDDGSVDDSGKICDEYAARDSRVRVFHKKNGGSSSARNLGITKTKGDYIGFIDSDDYIEPDMYEVLLKGIKDNNLKCAQVGRDEIDENGNLLPDICTPPSETLIIPDRDFLSDLLMHIGDCSFCTKLLSRDVFKLNGKDPSEFGDGEYEFFPTGVLNEDFSILVKKLKEIGAIASMPGHKYHVFYRLGSNSRKKDKQDFPRVFGDCVDNADMARVLVNEQFSGDTDLQKIALRFGVFQRLEYLLHIPVSMMKKPDGSVKKEELEKREYVYKQYREIVKWMRRNYFRSMTNSYLTAKNKIYHTLFAIAPRGLRVIHKKLRKID